MRLGVGAVDLVRDQDRCPEDRARDHSAGRAGASPDMVETGADRTDDADDREDQVTDSDTPRK